MTLAIEPMVLEGRKDTRVLGDGWTVKKQRWQTDRSL